LVSTYHCVNVKYYCTDTVVSYSFLSPVPSGSHTLPLNGPLHLKIRIWEPSLKILPFYKIAPVCVSFCPSRHFTNNSHLGKEGRKEGRLCNCESQTMQLVQTKNIF
jgi:hypothetical protein